MSDGVDNTVGPEKRVLQLDRDGIRIVAAIARAVDPVAWSMPGAPHLQVARDRSLIRAEEIFSEGVPEASSTIHDLSAKRATALEVLSYVAGHLEGLAEMLEVRGGCADQLGAMLEGLRGDAQSVLNARDALGVERV